MAIFYKIFGSATASKMGKTPTKPGRSPDIFVKVGRDFRYYFCITSQVMVINPPFFESYPKSNSYLCSES